MTVIGRTLLKFGAAVCAVAVVLVVAGPPGGTQTGSTVGLADRIAEDVRTDDLSLGSASQSLEVPLRGVVDRIAASGQRWAVVVVDDEPPNAKVLANEVLGRLRALGADQTTVVVLTPSSIGAESRLHSAKLDDTLLGALDELQRDPAAGIGLVFDRLSGASVGPSPGAGPVTDTADEGSGRAGRAGRVVVTGAAALAAAVALTVGLRRRRA